MSDFTTHRPTGSASYPIVLLAGVQGGGKSWAAAEATGLPYFKRSFWLELGEQMADEYGDVPGADYEIIDHDGSYKQILAACKWAARESKTSGPGVFVLDSATELWSMLSDEQQLAANRRMDVKAANGRGRSRAEDQEADVTVDLWNKAKDRSNDVMDALRDFNGLVILTARLDDQAVIGAGGQPTGDRIWKVRTHKEVPYYAQVVMQARAPRQWTMTKVASTKLSMPKEGYKDWPDFTIEELLILMELDGDRNPAARHFTRADPGAAAEENGGQRADAAPAVTADTPRGDLQALPERAELDAIVAQLEEQLDRDGLMALYNLAKGHGHRISMAKVESAGKRVKRRLDAGETPAGVPAAEDNAPMPADTAVDTTVADPDQAWEEAEEARLAAIAAEAADVTPDPEVPEETAPAADPEQWKTTGANPPMHKIAEEADAAATATAVDNTTGEAVSVQPDPEDTRILTPRRKGLMTALGNKVVHLDDYVFGQYGLDTEFVATARLQLLLNQINADERASAAT